MATTTHQVGHCIREVESALRKVLKPAVGAGSGDGQVPADKNNHRRQIRMILGGLGVAEDHPITQAWERNAERLHEWAHRHALNPPRPLDREFEKFFEGMERILETVLARFETRFGSSFGLIDDLLTKDNPQDSDARRLFQEVPNTVVAYARFFKGIQDDRWLGPLRREGLFQRPPEPEANEAGNMTYPPWPQSAYLSRVASQAPQTVKEIILEVPTTTNVRVLEDVADAALAMPPDLALEIMPKAVEGLDLPAYLSNLPTKLADLVVSLCRSGLVTEPLGLARELLVLVPHEEDSGQSGHEALAAVLNPGPRPRFDPPQFYAQVVDQVLPPLMETARAETFKVLCDLFEGAVLASIHSVGYQDEGEYQALPYEDNVYFYRPAIEDHRYNRGFATPGEGAMDRLLSAMRDAGEELARAEPARLGTLIRALEERGTQTFDRLALHLLHSFPEATGALELAAERLTANISTLSSALWHEYALLLRGTFASLSTYEQEKILDDIEAGPPEEELQEVREWRRTGGDLHPPLSGAELEESVQRHGNVWRLRRLAMLGEELLPSPQREQYRRLLEAHGDPHANPLFYNEPQIRSVPLGRSPLNVDDMETMEVEEIVAFLRDFEPTTERGDADPMDVVQELKGAVKSDPRRFARRAEAFRDLEPTYVRGLLWGLRESTSEANGDDEEDSVDVGSPFPWRPVLGLCQWVVGQPRSADEGQYGARRDLGWGLCRQWIADLLRDGLLKRGQIPFELRHEVWELLKRLSSDPEPTLAQEEADMAGARPRATPNSVSINSVRGVAMHAVVAYALWVRRNVVDGGGENRPVPWRSLADDAPEVRELLERRLDSEVEPTQTVRSVYGSWLPCLVYLDRRWVEQNLGSIFPESARDRHLRRAVWNTYITVGTELSREEFEVLRQEYRRSVENLNPERIDDQRSSPERHLAEHLMIFYWWGALGFGDPDCLLESFYELAPDPIRAKAAGFVGRQISLQETPLPADLRDRLEDLWERRLGYVEAQTTIEGHADADDRACRSANYSEELGAFTSWATAEEFDLHRSLERVRRGLALGADIGRRHDLPEYLAHQATAYPNLVTECVSYVVQGILGAGPDEHWTLVALQDDIYESLRLALVSGEDEATRTAREIVNILVVHGYERFQPLL